MEGAAAELVPMVLVVMPPPHVGPNRVFLCVPRSGAGALNEFVLQKGLSGLGMPRERCRATLAFVEQFLVTATDHWFMTPSFWNSLSRRARELVLQQPNVDLAKEWKPVVLREFAARC